MPPEASEGRPGPPPAHPNPPLPLHPHPEAHSASGPSPAPDGHRPDVTELARHLIGPQSVGGVAVVGLFLLASVAFLYFAKPFLLPVILAVLLNFLLKPAVNQLACRRVPRMLGAALVLVLFIGVISSALYGLNKPASEWINRAPESVRAVEEKIRLSVDRLEHFFRRAWSPEENPNPADAAPRPARPDRHLAWAEKLVSVGAIVGFTAGFLAGSLETLVLLYFLLASGDAFLQKLVRVLPKLHEKKEAVEIAHEVERNISTFLFTITLINTGIALVVALILLLLGLPNPFFWGAVAGLLNFIPYFGPFTMVLMLVLAGFLSFDSGQALLPPLCYLGVHAMESNLITPTILGRRLTLSPVVIFLSLMFWTWLWGVPGALLAVPLLMTFKIICDHFRGLAAIGEFLNG